MSPDRAIVSLFVVGGMWFATLFMIAAGRGDDAVMLSIGGTAALVLRSVMVRMFCDD